MSGIIEADGNFSINLFARKKENSENLRVQPFFRLELQQGKLLSDSEEKTILSQATYFDICTKIATFLEVSLYNRTRTVGEKQYDSFTIMTYNQNSRQILINYLTKFPFHSSKFLNFKDWHTICEMGIAFNTLQKQECVKIFSNFNNTRTVFSWDHLKNWKPSSRRDEVEPS